MTSTQTVDRPEVDGLTRRGLVKRGAVVAGATVWTAPVVQSLSLSSAFAATPSCAPLGAADADAFFLRIKDDVGNLTTLLPVLAPLFPGGVFTLGHASAHATTASPTASEDGTLLPLPLALGTAAIVNAAVVPVTASANVSHTAAQATSDVAIEKLDSTLLAGLTPLLPTGITINATSIHTHANAIATQMAADTTGTLAQIATLEVNGTSVDVDATADVHIGSYITVRVKQVVTTSGPVGGNEVADALARIAQITVAIPAQFGITPQIGFTITIAQSTAHASLAQSC